MTLDRDPTTHRPAKADFVPTPLNIATTQRYLECKAKGGHLPSDDIITRFTNLLDAGVFVICARCDVPYSRKHVGYNGRVTIDGIQVVA